MTPSLKFNHKFVVSPVSKHFHVFDPRRSSFPFGHLHYSLYLETFGTSSQLAITSSSVVTFLFRDGFRALENNRGQLDSVVVWRLLRLTILFKSTFPPRSRLARNRTRRSFPTSRLYISVSRNPPLESAAYSYAQFHNSGPFFSSSFSSSLTAYHQPSETVSKYKPCLFVFLESTRKYFLLTGDAFLFTKIPRGIVLTSERSGDANVYAHSSLTIFSSTTDASRPRRNSTGFCARTRESSLTRRRHRRDFSQQFQPPRVRSVSSTCCRRRR